jgi:lambda repressor-like predicted transcriptional regulator
LSDQACKGESRPVSQVRGVLAERVVVSTPLDPFLSLRALSGYSGLSTRTLRNHLLDPGHPLPYYRIGGKIIVRCSEYNAWAARYRRLGSPDLDRLAAEAVRDLRLPHSPRRQVTQRP